MTLACKQKSIVAESISVCASFTAARLDFTLHKLRSQKGERREGGERGEREGEWEGYRFVKYGRRRERVPVFRNARVKLVLFGQGIKKMFPVGDYLIVSL